jgi:hypothetical protein
MEQNVKRVKLIGLSYFISLGVVNFGATVFNGHFRVLDVIILLLTLTPLIVNTKGIYLSLGVFSACISLYMGFACFVMNVYQHMDTSQLAFMMGYLLAASSFTASLSLVYTGLHFTKPGRVF